MRISRSILIALVLLLAIISTPSFTSAEDDFDDLFDTFKLDDDLTATQNQPNEHQQTPPVQQQQQPEVVQTQETQQQQPTATTTQTAEPTQTNADANTAQATERQTQQQDATTAQTESTQATQSDKPFEAEQSSEPKKEKWRPRSEFPIADLPLDCSIVEHQAAYDCGAEDTFLNIREGHWGTQTNCSVDPECNDPEALKRLRRQCEGKKQCTFFAHEGWLGHDPCPGKKKNINMKLTCSLGLAGKYSFPEREEFFTLKLISWRSTLKPLIQDNKEKVLHILEIGAKDGEHSTWFVDNLLNNHLSTFTAVHSFNTDFFLHLQSNGASVAMYQRWLSNIALTGRAPQVKVMTTGLDLNLRQLAAVEHKYLTYDLIWLHPSLDPVEHLQYASLAWPLLKVNGTMVFDDYAWDPSQPSHFRPSTGVDAFLNIHNQYYKEIASGYELWIQKTDQQPFNSTKIKQYKITEEPAAASTDAVKPKHDEL